MHTGCVRAEHTYSGTIRGPAASCGPLRLEFGSDAPVDEALASPERAAALALRRDE